jgi:hypothetical protein
MAHTLEAYRTAAKAIKAITNQPVTIYRIDGKFGLGVGYCDDDDDRPFRIACDILGYGNFSMCASASGFGVETVERV